MSRAKSCSVMPCMGPWLLPMPRGCGRSAQITGFRQAPGEVVEVLRRAAEGGDHHDRGAVALREHLDAHIGAFHQASSYHWIHESTL